MKTSLGLIEILLCINLISSCNRNIYLEKIIENTNKIIEIQSKENK